MGLEGPTTVELDLERTRVREKTPEVPTSLTPIGSKEEGSATLRCASAGVGACAGVGVGAASYAIMLMIFRSIRH